jgi:hypothetical protein
VSLHQFINNTKSSTNINSSTTPSHQQHQVINNINDACRAIQCGRRTFMA